MDAARTPLAGRSEWATFELPLSAGLDLLGLGHSLDELLDDHAVLVAGVTGGTKQVKL